MSERSPLPQQRLTATPSLSRKPIPTSHTSPSPAAIPSGLNVDFSRVPASTTALQRKPDDAPAGEKLIPIPLSALQALPPEQREKLLNAGTDGSPPEVQYAHPPVDVYAPGVNINE